MANFVYQNGELRSAVFLKMVNFSILSLNVSLDYTQKINFAFKSTLISDVQNVDFLDLLHYMSRAKSKRF